MTTVSVGYVALLRRNQPFRRFWYGQVVSQLGDWLDSIALFTLLLNLTGSGEAIGALMVAQYLPGAIVGPFAGVVVDRLPRKLVLIVADIGRALLVLLLLLVHSAGDLWIVYVVVALKFILTAFFEPARSAITPDLCTREELVAANAISGATWSAMLAMGAALGGLVVGTLGVSASFLLDSASYVASAALIFTVRVANDRRRAAGAQPVATASRRRHLASAIGRVLSELYDGLRYIFAHPEVAWLTFAKTFWSMAGGVLLLLALFGRELFPLGRDGALSIGLLYAARGFGAGVGPVVAQRLFGDGQSFMRRAIGLAFFFSALGYVGFAYSPGLALAMLGVVVAHVGGSIQWVFSTALLQMRLPQRLRGRVFAVEYAGLTLTTALSSYVTGLARDAGAAPRPLALILAGVFALTGLIMTVALWRGRPEVAGEPAAA